MGIVERSVGLIKFGMNRIIMASPELTTEESIRLSCLSRNQCPIMSTGFSPSALAFGRSNLFDVIENGLIKPQSLMSNHEWKIQQHLLLLKQTRDEMLSFDAPRTLKMCLSRNIRPHANSIPGIGGRCHAIINGSWQGGWRFVSAISSYGLIEKDRKILKVPLSHIRVADLKEDPIIAPAQNESSTSSSPGS